MTPAVIFWGFLLRLGQGVIEASLTLLVGVLIAAIFRRMVGPAGTRKLFGQGVKGLLRGWLAGMLLPVCSLGVIPVAREMKRAGVPGGTVLAFVLAAPLLNPISFLYGLTLAEPFVICCFAVASLFLSTLAGTLWDRFLAPADGLPDAEANAAVAQEALPRSESPPAGPRRLLAVLVTSAREMSGVSLCYVLLGLVGSALLAAIIPFGFLQGTMKHSDPLSPLVMAAVGIPIYSSPLPGMVKIGLMFEHGNSIGAAFVLFVLGIGTNLGLIAWLAVNYRPARTLAWLCAWMVVILCLAYAGEPTLYDTRKEEIAHTHAFDDYSSPFSRGSSGTTFFLNTIGQKWSQKFQPLQQVAIGTLVLLFPLGLLFRRLDRNGALERWLTFQPPVSDKPVPWWNRPIPGPVLGILAILGLIVFSVIGAYIYYPAPQQVLDDMSRVHANAFVAVRTGKREEAIRNLELMDLLTRKLQVGVYIRTGSLSAEDAQAADELRELMEELRDSLLAGNNEEARELFKLVEKQYRTCREAYRPG